MERTLSHFDLSASFNKGLMSTLVFYHMSFSMGREDRIIFGICHYLSHLAGTHVIIELCSYLSRSMRMGVITNLTHYPLQLMKTGIITKVYHYPSKLMRADISLLRHKEPSPAKCGVPILAPKFLSRFKVDVSWAPPPMLLESLAPKRGVSSAS